GEQRTDADERIARAEDHDLGAVECVEHSGRCSCLLRSLVPQSKDAWLPASTDEVLLELHLTFVAEHDRTQPPICHGKQASLNAKTLRQPGGHFGQRCAAAEKLSPPQVSRKITVSQAEPGLGAI